MQVKVYKITLFLFVILIFSITLNGQRATIVQTAKNYINKNLINLGISAQDAEQLRVNDSYIDDQTGIGRVYFQQQYLGIPLHNALLNISMKPDGEVFHVGNRLTANLHEKVNFTSPTISAEEAVRIVCKNLNISNIQLRSLGKDEKNRLIFDKGNISYENIEANLCYKLAEHSARLAWDVALQPLNSSDMWQIQVDASNGQILDKINLTAYCDISHDTYRRICEDNHPIGSEPKTAINTLTQLNRPFYNIWQVPSESPRHGPRTLVSDPSDPVASPFGWHDTNGTPGAEYTITRGNNVHAYEDSSNKNESIANEPNGGDSLIFDFPYNADWEPLSFTKASVVNLFYANNFMHDFSYYYGFTEMAGNFQVNNYNKGGLGNDWVRAEAQDGGGTDNANFSTPADGKLPRMQMYLFNSAEVSRYLRVNSPSAVAGIYNTGTAVSGTWGQGSYIKTTPVSGEVAIYNDGVEEPFSSDACEPPVNATELAGKITLIDRGGCEFGTKVVAAQNAGAIAVVICNFQDATLSMGAGAQGINAKIPVVSLSVIDCQTIRLFAGKELNITLVNPGKSGPSKFDGGLDNGIIFHEYGHGISMRLTGGPAVATCLNGDEQMGEGWSDFMTLVTTVQPGDSGAKKRGIGNYAFGFPVEGRGIRSYPYSTDMSINPLTYADLPGQSIPHGIGSVWASMLWDLYWAFVDVYGWDTDLFQGKGGNNMAIRLVFEGMKNQPCNPGFVDGRDAILAADRALFGGANQCMIWDVFARRGVGYGASQGKVASVGDEVVDFKTLPACLNAMTIEKSVTPFIKAGDDIEVTLKIGNFKKATAKNVKIRDEIPQGTFVKAGSSNTQSTISGNTITFNLDSMLFLEEKTITYKLSTPSDKYSIRQFIDDVPSAIADDNWNYYLIGTPNAPAIWQIVDSAAYSGKWSWFARNVSVESRMGLELRKPWKVSGTQPALRFYHQYNTQPGIDGGVVDIKEAGASTWKQLSEIMFRNGYPGFISYNTFVVPNLKAFSGSTGGKFIGSYADLSSWSGKDIVLRFRFGTNASTAFPQGWFVDDIEFMDLLNYNGQACLTANEGVSVCVFAPERGTIVESQFLTNIDEEQLPGLQVALYPNPAKNYLQLGFNNATPREIRVSLLTVDARRVLSRKFQIFGTEAVGFDVSNLNRGLYFVEIQSNEGVLVKKVVLE